VQNMFAFVYETLRQTPLWVWVLLVYLIITGIKALKSRVTSLGNMSAIPMAFTIWGLWTVFSVFHGSGQSILLWFLSFISGCIIGALYASRLSIQVDRETGTISLPGSPFVLILSLAIFALKYALNVWAAVEPAATNLLAFLVAHVGITGLAAGMFAGRVVMLWHKARNETQIMLAD
jgi:hypothetical protein